MFSYRRGHGGGSRPPLRSEPGEAADNAEIQPARQQLQQLEPQGEAARKVDVEAARFQSGEDGGGRLLRGDERGHGESVLRGERCFHETGVDDMHADAQRAQVEVKRFGEIDQRGLGRPVGQRLRQPAKAGHAADQGDMPRALGVEQRQRGIEGVQRTAVVHIVMLQGTGQIEFGGTHGAVGAGAIEQQIEAAPVALQTLHRGAQGPRIGHVERQG